jgi:hypothetical protein
MSRSATQNTKTFEAHVKFPYEVLIVVFIVVKRLVKNYIYLAFDAGHGESQGAAVLEARGV